jgi:hypothetical protein
MKIQREAKGKEWTEPEKDKEGEKGEVRAEGEEGGNKEEGGDEGQGEGEAKDEEERTEGGERDYDAVTSPSCPLASNLSLMSPPALTWKIQYRDVEQRIQEICTFWDTLCHSTYTL